MLAAHDAFPPKCRGPTPALPLLSSQAAIHQHRAQRSGLRGARRAQAHTFETLVSFAAAVIISLLAYPARGSPKLST